MTDSMKIAFAFDPTSDAYLDLLETDYMRRWEVEGGKIALRYLKDFGGRPLFGDCPMLSLTLVDKTGVDELISLLENRTPEEIDERFPSGIFVRTHMQLQQTKKLRTLLEKNGIEVHAKTKAKRGESVGELLERTHFSSEVENFLRDFARDEPEHIVGLIRQVEVLNPKQQRALSVESLLMRLPQDPETSPPWEVEDPLWAGNTKEALLRAHKAMGRSNEVILVLFYIRKSANSILAFAGMGGNQGMSKQELSKVTGTLPNYGLVVAERHAKRLGLAKAIKIAEIVDEYDHLIRGGSRVDPKILMEMLIVRITEVVKVK